MTAPVIADVRSSAALSRAGLTIGTEPKNYSSILTRLSRIENTTGVGELKCYVTRRVVKGNPPSDGGIGMQVMFGSSFPFCPALFPFEQTVSSTTG